MEERQVATKPLEEQRRSWPVGRMEFMSRYDMVRGTFVGVWAALGLVVGLIGLTSSGLFFLAQHLSGGVYSPAPLLIPVGASD